MGMVRQGKSSTGSDQRSSLCQQPPQSRVRSAAANSCESPKGRGEESGGSWQEEPTKDGKDLEAERAREDRPWSELSGWHQALEAVSLGCSSGLRQQPDFQARSSISLVMWDLLGS